MDKPTFKTDYSRFEAFDCLKGNPNPSSKRELTSEAELALVNLDECREPGTLPMAKIMRKEAWHMQRCDQASGNPLYPSIYPKTRVCFMLSPTLLSLRGALPHNRFSLRRSKCAAPRQ